MIGYLKVFSPRGREEIDELDRLTREEPFRRAAQKALADDVTALVHGETERDGAVAAGQALFGQHDLADLPESVVAGVVAELGGGEIDVDTGWPTVAEVLQTSGVVASRSAGRRAATEGARTSTTAGPPTATRRSVPTTCCTGAGSSRGGASGPWAPLPSREPEPKVPGCCCAVTTRTGSQVDRAVTRA